MKTIEEIVRKAHDSLLSSATPNPYSDFFKLSDSNIILKKEFKQIGYFDRREVFSEMGSIATLDKNDDTFVMRFFIYKNRFGTECDNENKVHSFFSKNQENNNSEQEKILFYKFLLLHEFKHFLQLTSGELTYEFIQSPENQATRYKYRDYEKEANQFASTILREELFACPKVLNRLKGII